MPSFVIAAIGQLSCESKQPSWHIYSAVGGWGTVQHMILPAMVLGLSTMAYLTRLMRSSMLEIVSSDYIRTANAKGLPSTQVFSRHQLPNAVLPVVTVLGPAIASITTGGFVVEIVFAIRRFRSLLRSGSSTAGLHRHYGDHGFLWCFLSLHGHCRGFVLRLD
ncbi:MAG: hypothetical protein CM15mP120_14380 [Pseudomonadota bacterium]|nr:MAG: hypothetical protein CM15mP120_14380 [Pseudomonadota bacterium]